MADKRLWESWFQRWDDPRPTSKCLHCKGTGMADDHNECGFCFSEQEDRRG